MNIIRDSNKINYLGIKLLSNSVVESKTISLYEQECLKMKQKKLDQQQKQKQLELEHEHKQMKLEFEQHKLDVEVNEKNKDREFILFANNKNRCHQEQNQKI